MVYHLFMFINIYIYELDGMSQKIKPKIPKGIGFFQFYVEAHDFCDPRLL